VAAPAKLRRIGRSLAIKWRAFRLRPRPILTILILSFLVVTTPFVFSILHASYFIEHQADQSQMALIDVVDATRDSKLLIDRIKGAERSVRQFKLFRKENFRELVASRLRELDQAIVDAETNDIGEHGPTIARFRNTLSKIKGAALKQKVTDRELASAIDAFDALYEDANLISTEINAAVDAKVSEFQKMSTESRKFLLGESILVIPITIALILFFTMLFGRPLRQLEASISDLGDNNLTQPIRVSGPRDFRELGVKLNWLRLRLQELENEKQKFLRQMSHELKTPVANFQEGTSLLADEIPGPLTEAQREVVRILETNVQQFKQHISNLLDYNLVKFNKGVCPSRIMVSQLVDEIVNAYKLGMDGRNISVNRRGKEVCITADRSMVKAALDNIISNAINFSPDNGTVDIDWKLEKNELWVKVTDDGPGLKSDEIPKIFAPFFQGAAKRRGPLKGSGIGLSVAKECINSLGGMIEAFNQPDRGACFRMSVPNREAFGSTT
jgi:two-component system sensor histidine kinase GlrK